MNNIIFKNAILSMRDIVAQQTKGTKRFNIKFYELTIKVNWKKIVGEHLSLKTSPSFIKGDVIYIHVISSTWLHHLSFLEDSIITEINRFLNRDLIKKVKLIQGKPHFSTVPHEEEEKMKNLYQIDGEIGKSFLDKSIVEKMNGITISIEDEGLKSKFFKMLLKGKIREKILLERGYKRCYRCETIFIEEDKKTLCTMCVKI